MFGCPYYLKGSATHSTRSTVHDRWSTCTFDCSMEKFTTTFVGLRVTSHFYALDLFYFELSLLWFVEVRICVALASVFKFVFCMVYNTYLYFWLYPHLKCGNWIAHFVDRMNPTERLVKYPVSFFLRSMFKSLLQRSGLFF